MARPDTIYLDHNATTRPHPDVVETMARVLRDAFGNPGSRHAEGRRARQVLEDGRDVIAAILDADANDVVFTSGGTEATNMALLGLGAGAPGLFLAPPGEHPATEECLRVLESRGWRRHKLPLDNRGRLEPLPADLPVGEIRLATALLAHNETGTIQDLTELSAFCREHQIPLHIDAVQAVGKISVSFRGLGATTLAVGAHKFYGPRGIGALLIADGAHPAPIQFGGHQESGRRPGTECVALAAGMARALEIWEAEHAAVTKRLTEFRDRLETGLQERCPPVVIHGDVGHRLPNTSSIAFPGCDGDSLLMALDLEGICCSLGSTCASGSSEPASILVAMNTPPDVARATLRLSVGRENTLEQIDRAVERIASVVIRQRSQLAATH